MLIKDFYGTGYSIYCKEIVHARPTNTTEPSKILIKDATGNEYISKKEYSKSEILEILKECNNDFQELL